MRRSDSPDTTPLSINSFTRVEALPELLTPAEAFAFWRIGKTAGYALLNSGRLRIVRLGRQIRIPRSELAKG